MSKSLFGIDMNLDGKATALDDVLFMHMVEEGEKAKKASERKLDLHGCASDDEDKTEED